MTHTYINTATTLYTLLDEHTRSMTTVSILAASLYHLTRITGSYERAYNHLRITLGLVK